MAADQSKKVALVILDGWGWSSESKGNAIIQAKTPVMDTLASSYPTTVLQAASEAVGLPSGTMGNSEVGHTCLGAGRVVLQDYPQISSAIKNGSFYKNKVLIGAVETSKEHILHIIGIFSDAGVHGDIEHISAILELAKRLGQTRVYIHAITDGRDSPAQSAERYFKAIDKKIAQLGSGKIVSIVGRYFAMDRDQRWDRTEKAYNLFIRGIGQRADGWKAVLEQSYAAGQTDEFIEPYVLGEDIAINSGDGVILANFRPDRMIQLTKALAAKDFNDFSRELVEPSIVTMTEYEHGLKVKVAFSVFDLNDSQKNPLNLPLAEAISVAGMTQLHIAETEKYAHVTYFFNAGKKEAYSGEEWILIPSPPVATYDQQPAMSANEITNRLLVVWGEQPPDFTLVNFANADMVGHSGNFKATVAACETIDKNVGRLIEAAANSGLTILVTADHGNAEQLVNPLGGVDKEHSTSSVPLHLIQTNQSYPLVAKEVSLEDKIAYMSRPPIALLADVAPTIIELLGLRQPQQMTGQSLLDILIR